MFIDSPTSRAELRPSLPKIEFSRAEVAVMLGISVRTIDRLIAEKRLSIHRIGRRVLIHRDALDRFVKRDHQTGVIQ